MECLIRFLFFFFFLTMVSKALLLTASDLILCFSPCNEEKYMRHLSIGDLPRLLESLTPLDYLQDKHYSALGSLSF